MNKHHATCLKNYDVISDRIITAKLNTKPTPTNIIQIYAPTSSCSDDEIDAFYEELQKVKDKIPKREVCIIMGDFNAKVGEEEDKECGIGAYGLGERNERGDMLADFCHTNNMVITNTLFNHPKRKRYTWISPGERYRNQIDYILVGNNWRTSVLDSKSRPGADCDTDHILVAAKLRIKAFKNAKNKRPPKYNLEQLKNDTIKEKYQTEVKNRFEVLEKDWSTNQRCPDEIWDDIKKTLTDVAENTLGRAKKKVNKPFVSDEVRLLAKQKSQARKLNNWDEYKQLKKEIRQKIRRDKKNWLEQECAKINEANIQRKSKEVYNQIKKVTSSSFKTQNAAINDKDGTTLTETEEVLKRWHQYGQELFKKSTNAIIEDSCFHQHQDPEPRPLLAEVENAVSQLKDNKSPGLDNIPSELIKHSGDAGVKILHKLCCEIWTTGKWPTDWKIQEFVMLHKAGSTKECNNYRTIALISHASKILLIIILNRMKINIEYKLSDCQAGYRQDRGTRDMLFILQIMLDKIKNSNTQAFITFIDYSKAFDSVIHQQLFSVMRQMGFSNHLVHLIEELYSNQKATIRWNGHRCENFNIEKGVRQGCILSPYLFNIYTEKVMRDSEIEEMGIKIGGRNITNLRYADDTALLSDNLTSMKRILHRVDTAGRKAGLTLNAKKTKIMHVGNEDQNALVKIDGVELEQVQAFKYLGSIKCDDGSCTKDVKTRISMAKKKMICLGNIWKDRSIPKKLKVDLIKSLIWPVMIYGCEAWTLKQTDEKRIQAAEMWLYRQMLRISWTEKRTNESVLNELGRTPQLIKEINKRRLSYVGHITRHKQTDLMATVFQGKMEGRRKRGRPSVSYITNIRGITDMGMPELVKKTRSRQEWRKIVSSSAATIDPR